MDWSKGWESKTYASFIDKASWRDVERFEITGGRISRSSGELIESADIETTAYKKGEKWIRIWMDARQKDSTEHVPLFTGIATSPEDNHDGQYISNTLECYSVLKPMHDVLLPRGWYALKGSGRAIVEDLLWASPAPHHIADNMPVLKQNIIAEEGETYLSMLYKILLAIDWRIRITGDGHIHVEPQPTNVSAEFLVNNDVIEPEFTKRYDYFECPNVFRAVSGDDTAIAIDDSDSEFSVGTRGREIWAEEVNCNLKEGETLYEYASRRLKEAQMVAKRITYSRRYNPNVLVGDLIRLNYPQVNGTYFVVSQNIELGDGARTTEEAVR